MAILNQAHVEEKHNESDLRPRTPGYHHPSDSDQ